MNAEEMRSKSVDELKRLILDLRKSQLNARFQKAQGAFENTAEIMKVRRDIARAKTILNEKRREETSTTKKAA
tara:strand:- start:1989 stop:2207 length:219 start_codon:yes stop_codon:yes gene_type:complete